MAKYVVKEPLNHNNTAYPIGAEVELTEQEASALQPLGVVGEAIGGSSTTTLKADELIAQIKAAETVEAVDALLGTDTRKTVVDAANKRRAELGG